MTSWVGETGSWSHRAQDSQDLHDPFPFPWQLHLAWGPWCLDRAESQATVKEKVMGTHTNCLQRRMDLILLTSIAKSEMGRLKA